MEQAVLDWVARDGAGYGYLLDFHRRGGRVCWMDEEGLALYDLDIDIAYAGGRVPGDLPELEQAMLVLTDSGETAQALLKKGCCTEQMVCRQALYLKDEPPVVPLRPGVGLRPLTEADLPFVLENYHNPGAYESHIRGRIAEGMVAGEVDGQLAGFAGVHQEGALGMLEVLPRFRRRGLAEALEAAVIARVMEAGGFPYCHVRQGNTASELLQEKLGLTFDSRTLYWLE